MDAWLLGLLVLVFVLLAVAIPRRPGPIDHALDATRGFAGKAELNNNIERSRNVPPPP